MVDFGDTRSAPMHAGALAKARRNDDVRKQRRPHERNEQPCLLPHALSAQAGHLQARLCDGIRTACITASRAISADCREMRDNGFVYLAKAFAHQPQFFAAVTRAAGALQPDAVAVTPTLGNDRNGESAVFFQVVLADGIPRAQLLPLARQISQSIVQQVQPLEEWGVLPYFDFLTKSEQAQRSA